MSETFIFNSGLQNATPELDDIILQQNVIIKTREEKYRSKIKALEILVNGTNEENQVMIHFSDC